MHQEKNALKLLVDETLYLKKGLFCVVFFQDGGTNGGESEKKRNLCDLSRETSEDNDVFGT